MVRIHFSFNKLFYMAKKKVRKEVSDMLWSLNYVYNYINVYGPENDYEHDFVLKHLSDIKNLVEQDKKLKEEGLPLSSTDLDKPSN